MSHIYTVTDHAGRTLMHVKAKSKGEAKRAATKDITVKRLDGGEILELYAAGYAIVDAATGYVTGGDGADKPADARPGLPLSSDEE